MAPDTNNTQPLTLDRDDPQARRQSTLRQWEMLRGVVEHLPSVEGLETIAAQNVANNIAALIAHVRGRTAGQAQIGAELVRQFAQEYNPAYNRPGEAPPASSIAEDQGFLIADAWLKVLYRNIGEADVQEMINRIPPGIQVIDVTNSDATQPIRYWAVPTIVDFGTHTSRVVIDLQHQFWAAGGTADQIRNRMRNRSPEEVGIRLVTPLPAGIVIQISDAAINSILDSQQTIVDLRMPIRSFEMRDLPVPGQRTMVNLPGLLRENVRIAHMDRGALQTYLRTLAAADLGLNVQVYQANGDRIEPIPPAHIDAIALRLMQELSRAPGSRLCSSQVTLGTAMASLAPLQSLIAGTADNRELMLALMTIRRDPTTLTVLNAGAERVTRLQDDIRENDRLLTYAQNAKRLSEAQLPEIDENRIQTGRTVINAALQGLANSVAALTGPRTIYNPGNLTPAQLEEVQAAGLRAALHREREAAQVVNNAVIPARDNIDVFQREIEKGERRLSYYTEQDRAIQSIVRILEAIMRSLQDQQITADLIQGNAYDELRRFIVDPPPAVPAFAVQRGAINRRMDIPRILREYRQAMREAHPTNRVNIGEANFYEQRSADLNRQLTEAMNTQAAAAQGSDACWAVVRRGLENQGLRGKGLDNTISYMQAKVQLTPESMRDAAMLAEGAFPYLPPQGEQAGATAGMVRNWNRGKYARTWELGAALRRMLPENPFRTYNPWEEYRQRLFTRERLGIDWNENFENNTLLSTPQLVDAYFRLKYITSLPPEDPRHIPSDMPEIVSRMRRLHRAILDRAQQNFGVALGGMTDQDIIKALEARGMEVDRQRISQMTATDKYQLVHSFLLNGLDSYMQGNRDTVERIVESAYRPIRERVERKQRRNARLANAAWRNPHASVLGVAKDLYVRPPLWGVRKVWGGAKWTKREVVARKKGLGWGAAVGFLTAGPLGAALGAGIGALVAQKQGAGAGH